MPPDQIRRGSTFIIAAAVLWGTIGPFSLWATRTGLRPVEVAFWRAALALIPFALLAARGALRIAARDYFGIALFGAAGIAVMYGAFFIAVEQAGVGVAAVLLYTGPAWVAVVDAVAARRIPNAVTAGALGLTIGGVVLLSYEPTAAARVSSTGILFGLLSGLSFSTHFTFAPRYIARVGAPLVYAVAMAAAAMVLWPLVRPSLPSAASIAPLLYLALVATFLASLLFARGVVHVPPVRAAITATIEPVVAMILSIVVLGTAMRAAQLIGAALILAGVTVILRFRAARAR